MSAGFPGADFLKNLFIPGKFGVHSTELYPIIKLYILPVCQICLSLLLLRNIIFMNLCLNITPKLLFEVFLYIGSRDGTQELCSYLTVLSFSFSFHLHSHTLHRRLLAYWIVSSLRNWNLTNVIFLYVCVSSVSRWYLLVSLPVKHWATGHSDFNNWMESLIKSCLIMFEKKFIKRGEKFKI